MDDDPDNTKRLAHIYSCRNNSEKDARVFGMHFNWMGAVPDNEDHVVQIYKAKWGLDDGDVKPFGALVLSRENIPPALRKPFYEMTQKKALVWN